MSFTWRRRHSRSFVRRLGRSRRRRVMSSATGRSGTRCAITGHIQEYSVLQVSTLSSDCLNDYPGLTR